MNQLSCPPLPIHVNEGAQIMSGIRPMLTVYINIALPVWIQGLIFQKISRIQQFTS